MLERYTERAKRAIAFGKYEASVSGSAEIRPEHLLLGLLREADELVTAVLAARRLDAAALRDEVTAAWGVLPVTERAASIPLGDRVRRILARAEAEPEIADGGQIDPGHLLVGLLQEEADLPARILAAHGMEIAWLRAQLAEIREARRRREAPRQPVAAGPTARERAAALLLRALAQALDLERPTYIFDPGELRRIADVFARLDEEIPDAFAILVQGKGIVACTMGNVAAVPSDLVARMGPELASWSRRGPGLGGMTIDTGGGRSAHFERLGEGAYLVVVPRGPVDRALLAAHAQAASQALDEIFAGRAPGDGK